MLANRGQEIFVEASLEEVLESLVAHRLIDLMCQLRQRTMGSTDWVSQLFAFLIATAGR